MKRTELTHYFPAGGRVKTEIQINQVTSTPTSGVYSGLAKLPPTGQEQVIVIHQLTFEKHDEYRAIPAKCPHQGVDITQDQLKQDGNVYCSVHRRPICVYSEYNHAFLVEKRGEDFYLVENLSS